MYEYDNFMMRGGTFLRKIEKKVNASEMETVISLASIQRMNTLEQSKKSLKTE